MSAEQPSEEPKEGGSRERSIAEAIAEALSRGGEFVVIEPKGRPSEWADHLTGMKRVRFSPQGAAEQGGTKRAEPDTGLGL